MASFFNPKCAMPTFLMGNENEASMCGKINAYIISLIVSIIVIVISVLLYKTKKRHYINKTYRKNVRLAKYVFATIGIVILIWILIPLVLSLASKNRWRKDNAQINSYIKNGYDKKEAIGKMQDIYQSQIQANAITNAANTIANSSNIFK